ncbi:serum basic protease inhibitor [Galendromus occidentalis]|uniref:Serum basic protease inhibitor n=1 Tax=Galendromus occidentalis TaxID=34638 RepID=A0AAJ6VXI9_9ACAR|nr:serum basic protease inhibitor [Galendromus occidentalis]
MKHAGILMLLLSVVVFAGAAPDRCCLKEESGVGKAAIPMYYFDAASGECKTFMFGGLKIMVNDNRFASAEECMENCGGKKCS